MIQLHFSGQSIDDILNSSSVTPTLAYAQHNSGTRESWDEAEHIGDHPVVYVAKGSHASYFNFSYCSAGYEQASFGLG